MKTVLPVTQQHSIIFPKAHANLFLNVVAQSTIIVIIIRASLVQQIVLHVCTVRLQAMQIVQYVTQRPSIILLKAHVILSLSAVAQNTIVVIIIRASLAQ